MFRNIRYPVWAQPIQIADLVKLAIPVALSRLSLPIMSLTDNVVLGRMEQLEVPYVAVAWLLLSIVIAIGMGMLQGVQVVTAELNGADEPENTGRVFRRGMWVSAGLGFGAILFVWLCARPAYTFMDLEPAVIEGATSAGLILSYGMIGHMIVFACSFYLEALRRPLTATLITYIGVIANIVLDLALVAGWWGIDPMGADGVAWATTGSRLFVSAILIGVVVYTTPALKRSKKAPKGEAVRQNTVGMGGSIANVAEFSAFNLTFVIATKAGAVMGTVYALSIQPIFFFFMLFAGLATATSVRVAEAFGADDHEGVRNASRLGVFSGCLMGGVIVLAIYGFRDLIAAGMASSDTEVSKQVVLLLAPVVAISSLMMLFDGLQVIASMALRAQNIVWLPAAIHMVSYFLIMLPCSYWFTLVLGWGAQGTMWGVVAGSVFAGVLQVATLEWKTARH